MYLPVNKCHILCPSKWHSVCMDGLIAYSSSRLHRSRQRQLQLPLPPLPSPIDALTQHWQLQLSIVDCRLPIVDCRLATWLHQSIYQCRESKQGRGRGRGRGRGGKGVREKESQSQMLRRFRKQKRKTRKIFCKILCRFMFSS